MQAVVASSGTGWQHCCQVGSVQETASEQNLFPCNLKFDNSTSDVGVDCRQNVGTATIK